LLRQREDFEGDIERPCKKTRIAERIERASSGMN
jgi:hypothetical protein